MSQVKSKLFEVVFKPAKLSGFVLPKRILDEFPDGRVESNYVFYGLSGTGKTSLAEVLGLNYDTYLFEASLSGGIDYLRPGGDLYDFCNSSSLMGDGKQKMVILNELNGVSKQFFEALKGFTDRFMKIGVIFIATTNYINDIEPASISRMKMINFDLKPNEEKSHKEAFKARVILILNKIGCTYENDEVLDAYIKESYPDWRKVLQNLQFLHRAKITHINMDTIVRDMYTYNELYDLVANGNIADVKNTMVTILKYNNPVAVINGIDNDLFKYMSINHKHLIPLIMDFIVTITKYVDMSSRRVDPSLVLKAMIHELMKRRHAYTSVNK